MCVKKAAMSRIAHDYSPIANSTVRETLGSDLDIRSEGNKLTRYLLHNGSVNMHE